jgi:hypothetical protein
VANQRSAVSLVTVMDPPGKKLSRGGLASPVVERPDQRRGTASIGCGDDVCELRPGQTMLVPGRGSAAGGPCPSRSGARLSRACDALNAGGSLRQLAYCSTPAFLLRQVEARHGWSSRSARSTTRSACPRVGRRRSGAPQRTHLSF